MVTDNTICPLISNYINMDQMQIRKFEKTDLEAVFGLVRELAAFEKEPESVTAQIQDYHDAFDNGLIDGHVAELEDGEIVGMTLYFDAYSTWKGKTLYLDDFYVKEAFRKHGIGQLLFNTFIDEGIKRNARQLKWQVLDWNEIAIDFYIRQHAELIKGWWNGRILLQ